MDENDDTRSSHNIIHVLLSVPLDQERERIDNAPLFRANIVANGGLIFERAEIQAGKNLHIQADRIEVRGGIIRVGGNLILEADDIIINRDVE